MQACYEVYLGSTSAGKVQVLRQGLYYVFHCRCTLSGGMYRLFASCGSREESLGIVVPIDGGFGLDTRLPVKRLGEGTMQFRLVPKQAERQETVFPIRPGEPFPGLSQLEKARLAYREGKPAAVVSQSSSSPIGQWSEPKTSE